jgi:hypothetical protein
LITWKDVLEELRQCDGQITDYGRPVGQIMFDPTIGNTHAGKRIEWDTFLTLRDEGWIATEDQGVIKRYRISETGTSRLGDAEAQSNRRTRSAEGL